MLQLFLFIYHTHTYNVHTQTVTCQLVTLHDGMAYNSTEIVWNAEPKDVVYMSPYVLVFTADTVEIRMASNGSLIQTIAVPDLHLLSKKVEEKLKSTRF